MLLSQRILPIAAPLLAIAVTLLGGEALRRRPADAAPDRRLQELEQRLDALRDTWNIPGMSVAVASGGEVIWTKGLGTADLATGRLATADTVYHLASLTKPFAAVVLLQLVEEGKLKLEEPVSRFGIALAEPAQVVHLLTHTSEGTPGREYRYNGNRFSELDRVIVSVTGKTFARSVFERVLQPLGLNDTSPNPLVPESCAEAQRDPAVVLRRMAQGYDEGGEDPIAYPARFSTAAGLVSTASDVARFSMAWDTDRLLQATTRTRAFSPMRSATGRPLPYGLGWFVQRHRSDRLIWHYGWWVGSSSLIVKMPDRDLTFVVLANSDGLSRAFDLGKDENVRRSPFASAVIKILARE